MTVYLQIWILRWFLPFAFHLLWTWCVRSRRWYRVSTAGLHRDWSLIKRVCLLTIRSLGAHELWTMLRSILCLRICVLFCQCGFQLHPCTRGTRCGLLGEILPFHSRPVLRHMSILLVLWVLALFLLILTLRPRLFQHLPRQVGTLFLNSTWNRGTPAAQRVHSIRCRGIRIFPCASRAKSLQLCPPLCDPTACSSPDSSVHGTLQERILEWAVISFPRGSSWARGWTLVSHTGR